MDGASDRHGSRYPPVTLLVVVSSLPSHHMKTFLAPVYLFSVLAIAATCHAQTVGQRPAGRMTVEAIFSDQAAKPYSVESFSPAWSAEGSSYISSQPSKSVTGHFDLVKIDPRTSAETILIAAEHLIPEGRSEPLVIVDHQWSADRQSAMIFTNTQKVWRHHSRGDYWLFNPSTKQLRQVGADRPASSLMFAKFSPDGKRIGYVSSGDVYVENVENGQTEKITTKRSPEIINGTSDWVYEEEFDLKDCFRWSPDSRKVAFWEFDTSGVGEFILINNTDSLYPKLKRFKHTKPGQKNSAVRMGVVHLDDGSTHWLNVPGDPRENYIARAQWTNNNELMLQHLNRDQNENAVRLCDATTGESRLLFRDTDAAWVETCDELFDVDGGKKFTWISERDGWRHAYLVDAATGQMNLITPGEYDVIELLTVTRDAIYFVAAPEKPTDRYLYRAPISGGEAVRVTPVSLDGWNSYDISPDAALAIHSHSRFSEPPVTSLIELPSHQTIRMITDNHQVREELAKLPRVDSSFIRIGIGNDLMLDGWLMKPANFDPTKQYPLIVHVYGEPWGTTVTNQWGGANYLWHRMLAEQGYAVCSIDNRGTKVPRGRDFRKSIYRQIGILAAQDQASAVKALTGHIPWLDSERVGVWGWSGGGSMSLNAIFKYPDLYHTAVSVAPVPDMRYYDSIYQERYMSTPQKNPEGYRNGSPINFAKHLKGNLLVIHGTGDDNCHYQTIELLINELVKQDKQFSMMAYPNRSHSINEGANTSVHLRKLMTNYFRTHLPAGPR